MSSKRQKKIRREHKRKSDKKKDKDRVLCQCKEQFEQEHNERSEALPSQIVTKIENNQHSASSCNSDRISPTWEVINDSSLFSPSLTEGESHLLKYLDKELSPNWKLFPQPHLNGDRPDIVALNENVGIIIFEVKDWNLRNYSADGRDWHVNDGRGEYLVSSPIQQLEAYRRNLVGLYVPQLGEIIDNEVSNFACIRLVLYFHNSNGNDAKNICGKVHRNFVVLGNDNLQHGELRKHVPESKDGYKTSLKWTPELSRSVESWLHPPSHEVTHGRERLNQEQLRHAAPNTGFHRLKGVAGSGKSLVVAWRAAACAQNNRRVFVLCYNITLTNYLHDLIKRSPFKFRWENVVIKHFHEFCRHCLRELEVGIPEVPQGRVARELYFNETLPNAVINALEKKCKIPELLQQDAILIDEGQDFERLWYDVARRFLVEDEKSELLLVVDRAQNIYLKEYQWTDDMTGTGFTGRWGQLNQGYRLPRCIRKAAWTFAQANNLETEEILPPENQAELFEGVIALHQTNNADNACRVTLRLYDYLKNRENIHPQDVTILVSTHQIGMSLVNYLKQNRERPNHVFGRGWDDSRANKRSFWMGSGGIKLSTYHSFKGWEVENVIVILSGEQHQNDIDHFRLRQQRLIYVALTRAKRRVYFICAGNDSFGVGTVLVPENLPNEVINSNNHGDFHIETNIGDLSNYNDYGV
ncbi:MAG: NERD domain-containing protein [Candidatus Hatepunaea meridiana]|nr:NERD domain-containing protein [Candidatus Hatepunaea meridiana]